MTLAIAHREGKLTVIDAVREITPPFSPESAVGELAQLLRRYRVTRIQGDRYGGEWPVEQFRKHGITYEAAPKPKSDLYRDLLPLVNSRLVDLPDHPKLVNQLAGLELRSTRGGRVSIEHPPNAHDDLINAVAGVVSSVISQPIYSLVGGNEDDPDGARAWRAMRLMQHIARYG